MKKALPYIVLTVVFFSFTVLISRNFRVTQIPNGSINNCANCHNNPAGRGSRNPFGVTVQTSFLSSPGASGQVQWAPQLASIDSDGDGFTNGEELQDPSGSWSPGMPAPGNPALVTNPGNAGSKPDPTGVTISDIIPGKFELMNNYPNPFNPETHIQFSLAFASDVKLEVYNSLGQSIKVLENNPFGPGTFQTTWNATDEHGVKVNSGMYIYRLTAINDLNGSIFSETKRMIYLK